MSDQGNPVDAISSVPASQADTDDMAEDLRKAVTELRGEPSQPESKVILDRPRDQAGRFAEGSVEAKAAERSTLSLPAKDAPAPAAAKPADASQDLPEVVAPPVVPVEVPNGWKPELRAKFAELPPDIQAEIMRREKESHRNATRADDDRTFGRKVKETASPYLATIQAEGGTVEAAFQQFLTTAHVLRGTDKNRAAQLLHEVARQYNVPLGSPLQSGPQNPELTELRGLVTDLQGQLQAQNQQRQAQDEAGLQAQIDEFSTKPGHEHFETAKPLMAALLQSGQAKDLEDAYQMAIYANPDIRSTLLAAQQQPIAGKQAAERARSAAVSVTGSPAGGMKSLNGTGPVGSIEDDLRAAIASHSGRV